MTVSCEATMSARRSGRRANRLRVGVDDELALLQANLFGSRPVFFFFLLGLFYTCVCECSDPFFLILFSLLTVSLFGHQLSPRRQETKHAAAGRQR